MLLILCVSHVAFEELGREGCQLAWQRVRASDNGQLLQGIESESFCSNLISEHHHLFSTSEREKLGRERDCKTCMDVVEEALKRDSSSVLCAVRKALLATQTSGGATQHAEIAKRMEASKSLCMYIMLI